MEAARTPFTRRVAVAFLGLALTTAFAASSLGSSMVAQDELAAGKTTTTKKVTTSTVRVVSNVGGGIIGCSTGANKPRSC